MHPKAKYVRCVPTSPAGRNQTLKEQAHVFRKLVSVLPYTANGADCNGAQLSSSADL